MYHQLAVPGPKFKRTPRGAYVPCDHACGHGRDEGPEVPQEPGVEGQAVQEPAGDGKPESAGARSTQVFQQPCPRVRDGLRNTRVTTREHASHDGAPHGRLPGEHGPPSTGPGSRHRPRARPAGWGSRSGPRERGRQPARGECAPRWDRPPMTSRWPTALPMACCETPTSSVTGFMPPFSKHTREIVFQNVNIEKNNLNLKIYFN